jgi:anti-sigma-K factor RskA
MDQQLLREQCEAYVLGALEGEERLEVERLIGSRDPLCLAALEEARELVAQVALLAPVLEPPTPLRAKVLSAIAAEPQPNVVSITARRRPNYTAWAATAVAAGLAVVAIVARNNTSHWQAEFARIHDEYAGSQSRLRAMSADAERYRQVIAVLAARDARMIRLAAGAPQEPQFRAYWSQPEGLVLLGDNVAALPSGRTLQLWVVTKKGEAVSAGVFQPDQQGQVVMIAQASTPPQDAAALAISDEPAGGSQQPTTKPAWVGPVAD